MPCPLFVTGDIYSEKVSIYRLIIENKGIASTSQHQITDPIIVKYARDLLCLNKQEL